MPTDAELLRCYAETRSEEAFKELVQRHLSMVYFTALRKLGGDVHRAQEVAQDVFVDLGRKAAALSRRPVVDGWLYISACYAAAKATRTAQRKRLAEEQAALMAQTLSASRADFEWNEVSPVIDDVMLDLSAKDREVVLLRFFQGLNFSEMAPKLQLTEDGARLRLNRAVEKMRSSLARRGIVSTAAALSGVLSSQAGAAAPGGLTSSLVAGALKELSTIGAKATGLSVFNLITMTKSTAIVSCAVVLLATVPIVYLLRTNRNVVTKTSTHLEAASSAPVSSVRPGTIHARGGPNSGHQSFPSSDPTTDFSSAAADPKVAIFSDLSRGVIRIDALANIGASTPRAAVESFLWAIAQGTTDDISNMIALSESQKQTIKTLLESLPEGSRAQYPDPEHVVALFAAREGTIIPAEGTIQITSETLAAGNEVKISIHITTDPEQYKATRLTPDNSSDFNIRNGPTG